jgi:hypothetical protein
MTDREFSLPNNYTLYWGDLHKHMTGPGAEVTRLKQVVEHAREHLDFVSVFCYPFKWYRKGREGGVREESVQNVSGVHEWWERIQATSAECLDTGEFVTFPAYEWNGNRRQWGDHHIIYRDEGQPLDDEWDLPQLYENMCDRDALVIPHHTGYLVGERGKDWDVHDSSLSPVAEIYSSHGSSEGIETPVPMNDNVDMGPRTSGGTYQEALDRGRHVGVVASNDGPGLPGTWNKGLAGVWATDLTRDAIWDAIHERRTYGVTGDRIALWWDIDGKPIGSTLEGAVAPSAHVSVDCPRPLNRVELVRNGDAERIYTHSTAENPSNDGTFRTAVEFGWGPSLAYGDFEDLIHEWTGTLRAKNGTIRRVWPRFVGFGQSFEHRGDVCHFDLVTSRDAEREGFLPEEQARSYRQGLVLEYSGGPNTDLVVDLDGHNALEVTHTSLIERTHLFPFVDESWERFETEFGLSPEEIKNEDVIYHNARKVRIHRSHPRSACRASVVFEDLPVGDDGSHYYLRVVQTDNQRAWSSPIWIET